MNNKILKIIYSGLIAGFLSECLLGFLFTSKFIRSFLYDPQLQSSQFLEVTSHRVVSLPVTIIGLIVLSIIHAWLFTVFQKALPGTTWLKKGLFWGLTVWLMYWVFQEWFIFHTLLGEPLMLVCLELSLLLLGSMVEGLIISKFLFEKTDKQSE